MFKIIVALVSFFVFQEATAQSEKPLPQTGIKAAYMGSVTYPGFKIGIERPYKVIQIEKSKKRGIKTFSKEKYVTLNLGFYHHKTFHDNVYLLAEKQNRRQKPSGWFREFSPGIGLSRTLLSDATYEVSDAGEVTKQKAAGYTYAMVSLAGSIGYDFSKKKMTPLKAYLKPSLLVMAPFNNFVYPRPTVEIGLIYSPGNFLKANPKVKTRQK